MCVCGVYGAKAGQIDQELWQAVALIMICLLQGEANTNTHNTHVLYVLADDNICRFVAPLFAIGWQMGASQTDIMNI